MGGGPWSFEEVAVLAATARTDEIGEAPRAWSYDEKGDGRKARCCCSCRSRAAVVPAVVPQSSLFLTMNPIDHTGKGR